MTTHNKYEKPAVTVDVLLFTILEDDLKLLLIERGGEPFKGRWALPGGFVHIDESLDTAALRELREETGVEDVYMEQLYSFGDPNRDPRMRVITVSYMALIDSSRIKLQAATDASDAGWFSVKKLPPVAFDHGEIVRTGLQRLRAKLQYSNIVYAILPPEFRLSELQRVYEVILDTTLDKRNFRKKMLSLNLLEETVEREISGAHRPAMLYRFKEKDLEFFD